MNHCDYQIIEISPKALFIESGFNPREAVLVNFVMNRNQ